MPSLIVFEIYHSAHLICKCGLKGLVPFCVGSESIWHSSVMYFLRLSKCQVMKVVLLEQQPRVPSWLFVGPQRFRKDLVCRTWGAAGVAKANLIYENICLHK